MNIVIATFESSPTFKTCHDRYKELGYDPIIHNGLKIKNSIRKNQVCYLNFLEILKKYDDKDLIISEDDVWLNDKINIDNKEELNWLGWWRNSETQICGSMVIYIPKRLIPHVRRQFQAKNPGHLDYFLNGYFEFIVSEKPICMELQHKSATLEKIRKHKYVKEMPCEAQGTLL